MASWSARTNSPSSQTDTERLRSRENPDRQLALDLLNTAGDENNDRNQPNRDPATMGRRTKADRRRRRAMREAEEVAATHKETNANSNVAATTTGVKKRGRPRKHPATVPGDDEQTTATTNPTPSKKRGRPPGPLSAKKTPKRARRQTESESSSYSADEYLESESESDLDSDGDSEGERRERTPPETSTPRRSLRQQQEMGERTIMTRLRRRTQPPSERAADRGSRPQDDMYAIGATPPRTKGFSLNLEKEPIAKSPYTYGSDSGDEDDSREPRIPDSPDSPAKNAAEGGLTKRGQQRVVSPDKPAENAAEEGGSTDFEQRKVVSPDNPVENAAEDGSPKRGQRRVVSPDNPAENATEEGVPQEEPQAGRDEETAEQGTSHLLTAGSQGSECPDRQHVQVAVVVGEEKDDGQSPSHQPTLPSQEAQQEEAEDEQADTNIEENNSQDSSHLTPENTEERMPDVPVPETSQGKDDARDESCQPTTETEERVQGESLVETGQKKMDSQEQSYQPDEEDEGGEAMEDGNYGHVNEQDGDKEEGEAEKTRRPRFETKRVISPGRYRRHQSTVADVEEGLDKGSNEYMDIDKILSEDVEDPGDHNDDQDQNNQATNDEAEKGASERNKDGKHPSYNSNDQDQYSMVQRGASENDENDIEMTNTSLVEQTEDKNNKANNDVAEKGPSEHNEDGKDSIRNNNHQDQHSVAIDEEAQRGASDNDKNDDEMANASSVEQTEDQNNEAINDEAEKGGSEHNEGGKDPSYNNNNNNNNNEDQYSMAVNEEAQRGARGNDEDDVKMANTSSVKQTEVMQKQDKATNTDRRQEGESEDLIMEDEVHSSSSSSESESEFESKEEIEGLSDHPAFVEATRVFDRERTWFTMIDLARELLRKAHSQRINLISSLAPSVLELLASVKRARDVFDEHINHGNFTEPGQGLVPDIARKVSTVLSEVEALPEEELVLQSPNERLKRQRMLHSKIRAIQSYVVPQMVEMIVPAAIIYHHMAKTQMERGLPEMKQLFRLLDNLCEQVEPSRYSTDVVFKDRLWAMRMASGLLFYVYDNEMHKGIQYGLPPQQEETTRQNIVTVNQEAEPLQDQSTPQTVVNLVSSSPVPSPPPAPAPAQAPARSPSTSTSTSPSPSPSNRHLFTREASAALIEGLKKYAAGPNRYALIRRMHRSLLEEFSPEQLREQALALKDVYDYQVENGVFKLDQEEHRWLLTVN